MNNPPVVLISQQLSANISFIEGGDPASLPHDSVRITDSDNSLLSGLDYFLLTYRHLQTFFEPIYRAIITLLNSQAGDVISVNTNETTIAVNEFTEAGHRYLVSADGI